MSDLSTLLPLQAIGISLQLSSKEAGTLLKLLDARKDQYGRLIVPIEIDPMTVLALMDKGCVKNASYPYKTSMTNVVEITAEGREIIKKLILSSPSAYEMGKKAETTNWLQKIAGC